jgi:hypothetical protein
MLVYRVIESLNASCFDYKEQLKGKLECMLDQLHKKGVKCPSAPSFFLTQPYSNTDPSPTSSLSQMLSL